MNYCKECKVEFQTSKSYKRHLKTRKHEENLKLICTEDLVPPKNEVEDGGNLNTAPPHAGDEVLRLLKELLTLIQK